MTLSITFVMPLIVALVGLILWVIAKPIWNEVGKILFFCGVLAWLLTFGGGLYLHH